MSPIIEEIPLEEFDLSLSAMRIINPDWVLRVQNSMWLHGQLQPVVAREHEGKFMIIDGVKRVHAAVELMMETLQCRVLDIDIQQAKLLLLSYNSPHQSMEVWEEAMVLQDLQKTHSLDQSSLAGMTGHSRSWVSRRLSLIERIDEKVSSEIRMGTLTSSHARALVKLPRGNQAEVARVITSWGLTSRQGDRLVDAFLAAKDEAGQRHVLEHPEKVLERRLLPGVEGMFIDPRLSSYGNDLAGSMFQIVESMQLLLNLLDDQRFSGLNKTEKMIITPGFAVITDSTKILTEAISQLQIHKSEKQ